MRHAFIDKYSYLDSPLHRLPPSWKIASMPCFLLFLIVMPVGLAPAAYPLYFIFLLILIRLSRVPFSHIFRKSLLILPFLAFIIIVNVIFRKDGIGAVAAILFRSFLSVSTLVLFISITRFSHIIGTLSQSIMQ